FESEARATLAAIQGKYPRRPDELSEQVRCGSERWKVMLACWAIGPESRPTAGVVKDMHHG
ncbi:hypothetical protein FRC07_012947, partial [Ceratobasidium sp. 392]